MISLRGSSTTPSRYPSRGVTVALKVDSGAMGHRVGSVNVIQFVNHNSGKR